MGYQRRVHGQGLNSESEEDATKRANSQVQKALTDMNKVIITRETLGYPYLQTRPGSEALVVALRQQLALAQPRGSEGEGWFQPASSPEKEDKSNKWEGKDLGPGWNKSIFVEKKGKNTLGTSTKASGWKEYKADPWYRAQSPRVWG